MTAEERDVMSRIAGKLSLGGDHGLRIADELHRWCRRDLLGTHATACSAAGLELRASRHLGWYEADVRGRRYASGSKDRLLRAVAAASTDWVGLRRREDPRDDSEIRLYNYASSGNAYAVRATQSWREVDDVFASKEHWVLPRAKKIPLIEYDSGTTALFLTPTSPNLRCVHSYAARLGAITMHMGSDEARLLVVPHPNLRYRASYRAIIASAVAMMSDLSPLGLELRAPRVVVAEFIVV